MVEVGEENVCATTDIQGADFTLLHDMCKPGRIETGQSLLEVLHESCQEEYRVSIFGADLVPCKA